jgi:hypothetical protein
MMNIYRVLINDTERILIYWRFPAVTFMHFLLIIITALPMAKTKEIINDMMKRSKIPV